MNIEFNTLSRFLFNNDMIDRIGLTLVHSVWQIAVVVFLFAVIRMLLQRKGKSSQAVYWLGVSTLLVAISLPAITFSLVGPRTETGLAKLTLQQDTRDELATELVPGSSESWFLLLPPDSEGSETVAIEPAEIGRKDTSAGVASWFWQIADRLPPNSLLWIALSWGVGAFLLSLRTLFGWVHMRRLRATCSRSLSQPLKDAASRALNRFPVSGAIEFAVSKYIDIPTVIGFFRPVVLFPVSVLTELTQEQLELIIVHELAHVRRNDLLLNLVQTFIESMLFFHPCIWWVSAIVRAERENCCDDAAVSHGDPTSYAKALLQLENARPAPQLSMAANSSDLLTRVRRIAGAANSNVAPSPRFIGLVCLLILVGLLVAPKIDRLAAQQQESDYTSRKVSRDFSKTKLGKVLDTEMDKLKQVGFSGSVLVAHKGEIILARSEGYSDVLKKKKTRPSTLYETASITKSFTATAAMMLAQRGKLDLKASIADYLPGVPKDCEKITVLNLLRHESGIPATNYGNTGEDLKTAVRTMLAGGPQHDPGTHFEYWNQGYILLSEIVEKAAGKPYTNFLEEEIFKPCGMRGTCFTGDKKPTGFVESTGIGELGSARSCLEHPYGKMGLVYQGTGGIVSNVVDIWKFHKALIGDDLLNEEFKKRMFERGDASQACGWFVQPATNGTSKRANSGKVRGFCGDFRSYPESDSCIVVLANSDNAPTSIVANVIEGILLQPEIPGDTLDKASEKKIVGEFKDSKGRILVVLEGEGDLPTQYMIYWDPKNPSAPISRGTVLKSKNKETIFYQPGDPGVVALSDNKSGTKVQSIKLTDLKIEFTRFDIEAWSKAQKR